MAIKRTAGCVSGAVVSFILGRTLLASVFRGLLKDDKIFKALSKAVKIKGFPLILLIRFCPFPFPYSNLFFSAFESVSLLQFFLATLALTPKLLLHCYIGSQMFSFADPESRNRMDPTTKLINGAYIIVGTTLGAFTGWYLYRVSSPISFPLLFTLFIL